MEKNDNDNIRKYIEQAIEHVDHVKKLAPKINKDDDGYNAIFIENMRLDKARVHLIDAINKYKDHLVCEALCRFFLTDTTHHNVELLGGDVMVELALARVQVKEALALVTNSPDSDGGYDAK